MPHEEKKGLFATLKEKWGKFKSIGSSKKVQAKGKKVPQGKAYKKVVPKMSPQQKKATSGARKKMRKPSDRKSSRGYGR